VGLFIGPVILAVLLAVWREWLFESRQPAAR
jgi:predicted PurR-regulated permease PerM